MPFYKGSAWCTLMRAVLGAHLQGQLLVPFIRAVIGALL